MAHKNLMKFDYSNDLFVKRTALGMLLDILLKLKGFIFLPIYARLLGVTGIGLYGLMITASVFITIIFTLNLVHGLVVYTSALRDPEQIKRNYSTALNSTIIFTIISSIIIILISSSLLPLSISKYIAIILLYAYSIVGRQITFIFPQMFQRTKVIALATVLTDYSGALLALGLITLGLGAEGLIGGLLIVNFISAVVLFAFIRRNIDYELRIRLDVLRKTVKFSIPTIPHTFSFIIMDTIDKFFLLFFWTTDHVGIYQIGYSGASFVLIASAALHFTFKFSALKLWEEDKEQFYNLISSVLKWITVGMIFLVMALFTGNHIIVDLLGGPGFFDADPVVPILGLGMCALIYNTVFTAMFHVLRDSKTVMYIYIASAAANLGLNTLLVPQFGITGACVASALAYWVSTILLFTFLKRRFDLPLNLFLYARLLGIALLLMFIIWWSKTVIAITLVNMLLLGLGVTVLYVSLLLITKAINLDEIKDLVLKLMR